jgi:hypothetical protein
MYLHKMPIAGIKATSKIHNKETTAWIIYILQLLTDNVNIGEVQIGGPNIVTESDETKLGKMKYHGGHRVEGVWVVAGV